MYKRTGFQILHLVLLFIIVLNILDFFEVLNPFWDYVKKVVSWFLVGLLFYRLSVTKLFVGVKSRLLDLWFVLAAFALTVNDMLQYAEVSRERMLLAVTEYVAFFQESGPVAAVVNVTEGVWNSMNLGIVPSVLEYGIEYVGALTMNNPVVYLSFSYLGAESTYGLAPVGLSGSMLTVYNSLVPLTPVIASWGLLIGMLGMLAWSLLALRLPVQPGSFLVLIEGARGKVVYRFFLLFFIATFFFLFVFSLVSEWLAIAIDAPILMFAIIGSFLVIVRAHKKFSFGAWEEWVTHVGAEYVEPFMQLFTQKRTLLLGISGLLVLHLVTEVFHYLLPFILPLRDPLYMAQLGPGHDNLFFLVASNLSGSLFVDAAMFFVAAANVIAWFCLLTMPAYIWYKIYRLRSEDHERHHPHFSPFVLGLFSACLVMLLWSRMIWFKRLSIEGLVGVDFTTSLYASNPVPLVLVGLGVFVVVFLLAQFGLRNFLYVIPLLSSVIFMGVYAYLFFLSSFENYLLAGLNAFAASSYGLGLVFFLFLLYTAVFYASGYLLFLYEIVRD